MNVYAIVLDAPSEAAWSRIETKWENHYFVSNTLALVAPEERAITSEIADQVGMNDKDVVTGIVIQISHYYGWHNKALWEWLSKHE